MDNKKAFTIIELLVVIAIIAVLASIVLVNVNNIRAKARDARRLADIKQVMTALAIYYTENGRYPDGDGDGLYGWDVGNQSLPFLNGKLPGIMNNPPVDPLYTGNYMGYHYYRYPAGYGGCDPIKGAFYVLQITDFEAVSGIYPGSPGWSCPNNNWQDGCQWVAGAFENP